VGTGGGVSDTAPWWRDEDAVTFARVEVAAAAATAAAVVVAMAVEERCVLKDFLSLDGEGGACPGGGETDSSDPALTPPLDAVTLFLDPSHLVPCCRGPGMAGGALHWKDMGSKSRLKMPGAGGSRS